MSNLNILCRIETSIMLNVRLRIKLIINLLENGNTSTMASSYIYIATQMENYFTPLHGIVAAFLHLTHEIITL